MTAASVLPEPVSAMMSVCFPRRTTGIAVRWMSVGSIQPFIYVNIDILYLSVGSPLFSLSCGHYLLIFLRLVNGFLQTIILSNDIRG
jgi:hypothetical protein